MPYELGYCEIFNPNYHGWYNGLNQYSRYEEELIHTSYLFCFRVDIDDFFNNDYIIEISESHFVTHPVIRNWGNINPSCKMEIIQRVEIGEYTMCILKTFWLKIIQRKWKKYYHSMLSHRKNPKNLMKRQIYGKWI